MKVLVADDNTFYVRTLEHTLRGWGYDVVAVADGRAAWEAMQGADPPRLAVLDWMMPGLDGLEVCRRVRAAGRPAYVILLTARDSKESCVTGLQGGADDYIRKPFDRDELRARLQVGLRIVELQASLADRVRELEHALSAARRLEVMGKLAGGVAHDFNNLLTIIVGGCDLLGAGPLDAARRRELLAMVREAGARGAALTRQLLAFSSKQVLEARVVSPNQLVNDLGKLLRRLLREDVTLTADLDAGAGHVRADPGQLEQVLMNLVLNARDALPEGGEIAVQTRAADLAEPLRGVPGAVPAGSYVVLRVRDNGCGMDDAVQAHLFEPFFTTKGPGKGTGLGLATVYGVVKQSGGYVQVDSRPGRGTTFAIYLPRLAEPAAPEPAPAAPAEQEAGDEATVLLVEDEDGVRVIARQVLREHAFTVLEARDGREALDVSAGWPRPIDLLLTDVVMPNLGGRGLADALCPQRPAMKVLYMSGYADDALVRGRLKQSGDGFLQKPFSPGALVQKVREVLEN